MTKTFEEWWKSTDTAKQFFDMPNPSQMDVIREAFEAGRALGTTEGYAKGIEDAAKIAETEPSGYLCPYGKDKPGDPTYEHTDDDICPICGANGPDALFKCHDTYAGRTSALIRALAAPQQEGE